MHEQNDLLGGEQPDSSNKTHNTGRIKNIYIYNSYLIWFLIHKTLFLTYVIWLRESN